MLSEIETKFLYFIIVVLTTFFARLSNYRMDGTKRENPKKLFYIIAFSIAAFFLVFSHIGTDYSSYIRILEWSRWDKIFSFRNAEPGFMVIWLVFKSFCNNSDMFLGLIKFFGLFLAFRGIWKINNNNNININSELCIMGYMCFLYLDNFNLIRMMFSVNICIYATSFLLENKNVKALLLSLIAITMHTSAIFYFLSMLVYCIYIKARRMSKLIYIGLIIGLMISLLSTSFLFNYLINNFNIFEHYTKYSAGGSIEFSPIVIMRFFPIVYLIVHFWNNDEINVNVKKFALIMLTSAIFILFLSYRIKTVTRVNSYFYILQTIIISYYVSIIKKNNYKKKMYFSGNNNYRIVKLLIIIYNLTFLFIKFSELVVSEIQNYYMIW